MATNCYLDATGCLVCPEIPATPAIPAQISATANAGWNGGANSLAMLAGDVVMTEIFTSPPVGIVLGFKSSRLQNTVPSLIDHGFYMFSVGPVSYAAIMERGVQIGNPFVYQLGALIEIRRVSTRVTYLLNKNYLLSSKAKTTLPVVVNACLYTNNDAVP